MATTEGVKKRSEFRIWLDRTFGRTSDHHEITVMGMIRTFVLTVVYFTWAGVMTTLSIISYFIIKPIGGLVPATKVVSALVETFFIFQVWMFQHYVKSELRFYGDRLPLRESAFIIGNHQWLLDWALIFAVACRKGMAGATRFFAKRSVIYIPAVGLGVWIHGCVFLDRNWDKDKHSIERSFDRQRQMAEGGLPMWIGTWPESTRFSPEKLHDSHLFAKKMGLPEWNHVLIPRTKGFIAQMKGLRSIVPYVYDMTVGYGGSKHLPPTPLEIGTGTYGKPVHIHFKRYKMTDIPEEEEALKKWLFDRWQEKEDLLAYYDKHDRFPGDELVEPFRIIPVWKSLPKDE